MREGEGTAPLWRREARALARQARLMAAGVVPRPAVSIDDRVVLFVHGFLAGGPVFDPMRAQVEAVIGLPTLAITYLPWTSFDRSTAALAAFIDRQVPATARLDLVGHSLGGLVARWYVQELGGHVRVDRLITLATPHAGTDRGRRLPLSVTRALDPHGVVVRRLEQRAHRLAGVSHTVIVAGDDHMISPRTSAAAVRQGRVVWLPDVGHNGLLFDSRAIRTVTDALRLNSAAASREEERET